MSVAESLFWPVSVFPTEFVCLFAYRRISVLYYVSVANSVGLSESVLPSQCVVECRLCRLILLVCFGVDV